MQVRQKRASLAVKLSGRKSLSAMYQRIYSDFDAYAASVAGVDSVMVPQNLQRRSWGLKGLDLTSVALQAGAPGGGAIVEGTGRPDAMVLYLPSPGSCSFRLNGERCAMDSFIVVPPGSSFHLSTTHAHDWCMIVVPSAALPDSVNCMDGPPNALAGRSRVSAPNPRMAKRFRRLVRQVLASAAACERFEASPAARNAAVAALAIASSVAGAPVPARRQSCGRPRMPRRQIVNRCLDLFEVRQAATIRVDDLCAAAGVSDRTLRNVFHEYFGLCPRTFLRLRRANAVRRALGGAEPDATSVTEVLVRHGEWEFGRFAVMYRQFFGERPSETLRKSLTRTTMVSVANS